MDLEKEKRALGAKIRELGAQMKEWPQTADPLELIRLSEEIEAVEEWWNRICAAEAEQFDPGRERWLCPLCFVLHDTLEVAMSHMRTDHVEEGTGFLKRLGEEAPCEICHRPFVIPWVCPPQKRMKYDLEKKGNVATKVEAAAAAVAAAKEEEMEAAEPQK